MAEGRRVLARTVVSIIEPPGFVPVNRHAIRHERIEADNLTLAIAQHLRVGVAPQEQVGHHHLTENERGHFRVGFIVQQRIQPVIQRLFFASLRTVRCAPGVPCCGALCAVLALQIRVPLILRCSVAVKMQRQAGDGLGQNADTGVYRCQLHGGALIDVFTAGRTAE